MWKQGLPGKGGAVSRAAAPWASGEPYREGLGRRSRCTAPGCSPPAAPGTRCAASTDTRHTAETQALSRHQPLVRMRHHDSRTRARVPHTRSLPPSLPPSHSTQRKQVMLKMKFIFETVNYLGSFLLLHLLKCALVKYLTHKKVKKLLLSSISH